jgi:hypothetical protein
MNTRKRRSPQEKIQYLRDLTQWAAFEVARADANAVIGHMERTEGATLRFSGGAYVLRCGGVGASSTMGGVHLLDAWRRAANRTIMRLSLQTGGQ